MDEPTGVEATERHLVEKIFRWGLLSSTAAMFSGFLLGLASGDHVAQAIDLGNLTDASAPGVLMDIGIAILAVTPAANVVALMLLYARRRQLRLTLITMTVLLTLVCATILGRE